MTERATRLEVERPVEGAVAAADDDDVLADVGLEAGHEELQAAAQPAVAGRQRSRAELADAGGDQDDLRAHLGAVVETDRHAVLALDQGQCGALEEVLRLGQRGLLDQALDQLTALDRREAGHVEDLLLGVHRGDLAAELGQRVDDGDPHAAEAGVVGGEQTGGTGADDEEVGVNRGCGHAAILLLSGGRLNYNLF